MIMQNEDGFMKRLQQRGLSRQQVDFCLGAVREFEQHLEAKGASLDSVTVDMLKRYVALLMEEGKNSMDGLIALARYCGFAKKNDIFIYLVSLVGAADVLPGIGERLATIVGEDVRKRVFKDIKMPPLGSPQEDYPLLTQKIVDRMEAELPIETCREVLTWNYHKVPVEAFKEMKERFEKAKSIDEFLAEEHKRFVEELSGYMKEGQLWYEQEITPAVLEFVKKNPEINLGVRRGNKIYALKFPYAPEQYLKEKDPRMKRFYACHCQLARTAVRDGKPNISSTFCYCSAGYEKIRFDVIFGEPVEIELLESVLKGDPQCRFSITIPKGKMK
jgi:hypothetical protein